MYRISLLRFVLSGALAAALVPAVAAAQSNATASGSPAAAPAATSPRVPAPTVPYRWSGFYLGGHADFGRGTADTTFEPLPTPAQFANLQQTTLPVDANGTGFRISGGVSHRSG